MPRSVGTAGQLYAKPKKGTTLLPPSPSATEPRRRGSRNRRTHTPRRGAGVRRRRRRNGSFPKHFHPASLGPPTFSTLPTDQVADSTVPKGSPGQGMHRLAKTIRRVFRQHP